MKRIAYKVVCGETMPAAIPPGREAKKCANCGRWFHMPRCHAHLHHSCSAACGAAIKRARVMGRKRECVRCGSAFIPRQIQITNGGGKYCSQKCNGSDHYERVRASLTPQAIAKRSATFAANLKLGIFAPKRGKDHPRWSGGRKTFRERCAADPSYRDRVNRLRREYVATNPDKVREWTQSRDRRKHGRLPRGTVAKQMAAQGGKCVYCLAALNKSFHVDHKTPLARGGKHRADNIQLLCGPCNVRKWTFTHEEYLLRAEGRA